MGRHPRGFSGCGLVGKGFVGFWWRVGLWVAPWVGFWYKLGLVDGCAVVVGLF